MEERKIKTVFSHDEVTRNGFTLPLWTARNLEKYTKKAFRHWTTGSISLLRREIKKKSFMILPAYCLKTSFQDTAQDSTEPGGLTELRRQKKEFREAKATRIWRQEHWIEGSSTNGSANDLDRQRFPPVHGEALICIYLFPML